MKSFIFKQILFSEVWFKNILPTEEEKHLIRILYNKPASTSYEDDEIIIGWDEIEESGKLDDDKWCCYDERKPFHHQIFPSDTQAYARLKAAQYIEELDSFLEWFYDDVESYLLERYEAYQRKFELIN
ncbi:hypothetical protein [Histophilus somni]|uniref:hypothetical protein n=1 Tax=Histophilus somni TaxID=731 RepID=UPI00201F7A30|nr:hypothetical protein [Histophilus somni]